MEELIDSLEGMINHLEELKRNIPHSLMFSYSYYSIIENNLQFTIENLRGQLANVKEISYSVGNMKTIQRSQINSQYSSGFYNGMEAIISIMEQREAEFVKVTRKRGDSL